MKKSKTFFSKVKQCLVFYFDEAIAGNAAELSYYFLFTFFTLIMAISAAVIMLKFNDEAFYILLVKIFPKQVYSLIDDFISYIKGVSNLSFFFLGIFLAIYSMSRYINSLKRKIRSIYRSQPMYNPVFEWVISAAFSALIIIGLLFTFVLQITGKSVLTFLASFIPFISDSFIDFYLGIRFFIIGSYIFILFCLFYKVLPNKKLKFKNILPGSVFSSVCWVLISYLFSFYVDNISNYSVVYGSIGAFIVLLSWIYFLNNTILIGAVINRVFEQK